EPDEPEESRQLSQVLRALASDYRKETRAAIDEAVGRARIPPWKLLVGAGVLVGVLVAGLILFAPAPTTNTVLLKIEVNYQAPTLVFVLDDTEIPAQALRVPLKLTLGEHELVVLRDSKPVEIHRFKVGRDSPPEIALKEGEPPPGEEEAE